eukprot:m.23343 g.23343  ORF g.23343 m.23343 type:complete len:51 (-) comp9480_c0_seq1:28-180(-)
MLSRSVLAITSSWTLMIRTRLSRESLQHFCFLCQMKLDAGFGALSIFLLS